MTLSEKLKVSEVIASKEVTLKQLNISSKDKRLLSILSIILITLYTIYTKLILNNYNVFDWLVFFTLLNIFSTIAVKVICNSTYALNHYRLYSFIFFISKSCKVAIFAFSLINYVKYFVEIGNEEFIINFFKDISSIDVRAVLDYTSQEISFIVSLVVFIPTAIYFIILCIKTYMHLFKITIISVIPFINVVYYLIWLFNQNPYFLFYQLNEDNNSVLIEKRKIDENKVESTIPLKFLISLPLVVAVCTLYYYLINLIKKSI